MSHSLRACDKCGRLCGIFYATPLSRIGSFVCNLYPYFATNDKRLHNPQSFFISTLTATTDEAAPSFFSSPYAYLRHNVRDEIVVVLCLVFNSTFASVSIETAAFPWMDFLFGWTILANSMFGSVACAAVIITYFFLHRLSKKFDDRIILLALQVKEMD